MTSRESAVLDFTNKSKRKNLLKMLREQPVGEVVLQEITEILVSYEKKDFKRNPLKVWRMTADPFNHAKVFYSKLASESSAIAMTRDEMLQEIIFYIEQADKDSLLKNPYIYGLHVLEPINLMAEIDPKKFDIEFPDVLLPQIKSGNIPHYVLHQYPPSQVRSLLQEILAHATKVDISFRPTSAGQSSHKVITLD